MLTRTALALLLLLPIPASAQDLAAAVSAVVRISGTHGGTPVRGSGFVVALDGDKATIVTASHVIEGVQQLEVTFSVDRTQSFPAGAVLGMESGNPRGLAVFQVRGVLPVGVTMLSFATEEQVVLGEDLFLVGFPNMATAPLALRRTFAGPDGNFLQLDRPAGEGFSGAPVLRGGKVLGVVVEEDPQLTFAVKALVAQAAVSDWGSRLAQENKPPVAGTTTQTKPAPPLENSCRPREEPVDENGIVFVRICPGTFTMGSPDFTMGSPKLTMGSPELTIEKDSQADSDEKPAHQVTLSQFWIGETEITNEQYRGFDSTHQGEAELPVTNVSWDDAKAACEHFGGRLPTEAEWEYAARAGSQAAWSFGDDEKKLDDYAWYDKNSDTKPHPVRTKSSNAWGLHDMHGNVWEWVADWYAPYSSGPQNDPTGPKSGESHVLRGGAFYVLPKNLRSADRDRNQLSDRSWSIGFRCARSSRRQP